MKGSKYDDIVTMIREATGADLVHLIIVNGRRGSGGGMQATADMAADPLFRKNVANVIRLTADQLESDPGSLVADEEG